MKVAPQHQKQAAPEQKESNILKKTSGKSEELFRCLVQELKDYMVIMLDPEGRVVSWNPGAERLLGYDASEVVGQHCSRLVTQDDRKLGNLDRELQKAAAEGRVETEVWLVRKGGGRFWATGVTTALWDSRGRLRGFAKLARDTTERKRTEEASRDAQAQLGRYADDLEQQVSARTAESLSASTAHWRLAREVLPAIAA